MTTAKKTSKTAKRNARKPAAKRKATTPAKRNATTPAKRKASLPVSNRTSDLRELAPLAREINTRLEQAAKLDEKAFDHRLAAAIRLAEAKAFCQSHKINFRKWCEQNVAQAYDTVRKLATVGSADDPKLALEDLRERTKRQVAAHREKKAASNASNASAKRITSNKSPFEALLEQALALDEKAAMALAEAIASNFGFSVVAKTDARFIAEHKSDPAEAVYNAFVALPAFEQANVMDRLSARPKAKAKAKAEAASKAASADIGDIPSFLDRRPKKAAKRKPAKRNARKAA